MRQKRMLIPRIIEQDIMIFLLLMSSNFNLRT